MKEIEIIIVQLKQAFPKFSVRKCLIWNDFFQRDIYRSHSVIHSTMKMWDEISLKFQATSTRETN